MRAMDRPPEVPVEVYVYHVRHYLVLLNSVNDVLSYEGEEH